MTKISHHTIAKRLKLSRATVTRSLSNHPSIGLETRRRVQELAAELGYASTPGRTSRRRKLTKNITIGILIGVRNKEPGTASFPTLLKGIQDTARLEEVNTEIYFQDPDVFDAAGTGHRVFSHLRSANWRGAILIYPFSEPSILALAKHTSIVSALEDYSAIDIDSIDTDHSTGIISMVERLVAAGHRRIGYAAWHYPVGGHWTTRRFAAYVEGLSYHGIRCNYDWVFNVVENERRLSRSELADVVAKRTKEDGVTAWVCAADHQAYELIRDLAERGLQVPRDCSVTGFDGIPPPYGMPQIATAYIPIEEVGGGALMRVLNRIRMPQTPTRKILVGAQVIKGTSIAAPPTPRSAKA